MKNAPRLVHVNEFKNIDTMANINGKWVPARAMGFYSLPSRLKLAWNVFTGKYDALKWEGQ